jgi:hypothetical protein
MKTYLAVDTLERCGEVPRGKTLVMFEGGDK